MTKYTILERDAEAPRSYTVVAGNVEAASAQGAIRVYLSDPDITMPGVDGRATYVAVPERSFREHAVAVQTQTRLMIA